MNRFYWFCGRAIQGAFLFAGVCIWLYLAVAIGGAHAPFGVKMILMLGLFLGVFFTTVEPVAQFFDPNWPKDYYKD